MKAKRRALLLNSWILVQGVLFQRSTAQTHRLLSPYRRKLDIPSSMYSHSQYRNRPKNHSPHHKLHSEPFPHRCSVRRWTCSPTFHEKRMYLDRNSNHIGPANSDVYSSSSPPSSSSSSSPEGSSGVSGPSPPSSSSSRSLQEETTKVLSPSSLKRT